MPDLKGQPIAVLALVLMVATGTSYPQEPGSPPECFRDKLLRHVEAYARGWTDLGPFRLVVRDPLPWDREVERKWQLLDKVGPQREDSQ